MIITQTPFRISFFGGGTDMPEFFNEHGGAVISTTFNKYCYVTVRHLPRFFDYTSEISYSKIERVKLVDEIQHPSIREAMKMLDMHELRITYEADLPARTGLGTSSSFAVGMLNSFYALKGKYAGKRKLADDAIYLERNLCNEAGGLQDQVAASFGGFNRINFINNSYEVVPVIISPERKKMLNQKLMLFYTGVSRFSAEIQKDTVISIKSKQVQLLEMLALVDEAEKVLTNKNIPLDEFGALLDRTWKLKRQTGPKITTGSIDELYEAALNAGALGGKLLGAGGGGFLLFYVPDENQLKVREVLKGLMQVPFSFENDGTKIIHYEPEEFNLNSDENA